MAINAACDLSFGKLLAMNVFMAVFALRGSCTEISMNQLGFQVGRFVTVPAGGATVRANQRERSRGMVEAGQISPRLSGMACLTTHNCLICSNLQHTRTKLPVVRIGMATRAAQVLPVIYHSGFWLEFD